MNPNDPAETDANTGEATPQARQGAARIESLLDTNASFDGHFRAEQDLRIQGSISGEVTCRGLLTIEKTATATARIEAHDLDIYGTVEGELTCTGRLRLGSTAVVSGTVKAGSFVVEEGASVNGTIEANFSGEGGVIGMSGRRSGSSSSEGSSSNRRSRGSRDLPSFAFVPSEESTSEDPESAS